MYRVRFNLSRGIRYKTWKIEDLKTNKSINLQPDDVSLIMINVTLKNNKKTAIKIFEGKNKSVCAWIYCEKVLIDKPRKLIGNKISFNPRIEPNWVEEEIDVDNKKYDLLKTMGCNIIKEKL